MKTVEKRYFVCEICGKTSQDEDRIAECQKSHYLVTDDTQIEHYFNKGRAFPKTLCVTFTDGSWAEYILGNALLAPAKPKEEEAPQNAAN